jgi:uroporphyrinogen decarboxylase
MTSRERWLALLAGEKPDRIPTDYWATPEVTQRLLRDLECDSHDALYAHLHIDAPRHIGAGHARNGKRRDVDLWGIRRRRIDHATGTYYEVDSHPLAEATTVAEVDAFPWPAAADCDFDAFAVVLKDLPRDRLVRCGGYEPFLLYCALRGLEQAFMDLALYPDLAAAALSHIFDYHFELNQRMFEMAGGLVDLTYVAEDLGSQHGLLMSVDMIRQFILPNQKRMADMARSYGIHIFYHTDGAARDIIPDLIDVTGIEVLNPVQWRCPGMEREGLVRDFGDRVIFHGAMDNQYTLAFGSTEEVRQEVRDNIRIFAPARWICAPCHNIQPVSPTANIVTMYETIHECGVLA